MNNNGMIAELKMQNQLLMQLIQTTSAGLTIDGKSFSKEVSTNHKRKNKIEADISTNKNIFCDFLMSYVGFLTFLLNTKTRQDIIPARKKHCQNKTP